jgi:hypothetical protein
MRLEPTVSACCSLWQSGAINMWGAFIQQHDYMSLACSPLTRSHFLCNVTTVDLVIKALRKLPWLNEAEVRRLPEPDETHSPLPCPICRTICTESGQTWDYS